MKWLLLICMVLLFTLSSCWENQKEEVFYKQKECLDIDWKKYVRLGTYQCGFEWDVSCRVNEEDVSLFWWNWVFYSQSLNTCLLWYHYTISQDLSDYRGKYREWRKGDTIYYIIKDILNWKTILDTNNWDIFDKKIQELNIK